MCSIYRSAPATIMSIDRGCQVQRRACYDRARGQPQGNVSLDIVERAIDINFLNA